MMFHIHKWGKWEPYKESPITAKREKVPGEWYYGPEETPRKIGFALVQKRVCLKCGKTELDMQEVYI